MEKMERERTQFCQLQACACILMVCEGVGVNVIAGESGKVREFLPCISDELRSVCKVLAFSCRDNGCMTNEAGVILH